jgi:hypothetical protein
MEKVYILHHSYEIEDRDETKLIGVYETQELADKAIKRLMNKPGFRDRPDDFVISEHKLNSDSWTEGYRTLVNIKAKDKTGNLIVVQAEYLINGLYKIFGTEADNSNEFQQMDIVDCENIDGELVAVRLIERQTKK